MTTPFKTPLLVLALVLVNMTTSLSYAEFTPIAGWDEQLYPSYLLATAKFKSTPENGDENILGDPKNLLGVVVPSPADDTAVTVTIQCDEIMQPSTFHGTLPSAGETYTIYPRIKYLYEKLSKIRQATLVNVTYRVEIDGEVAEEQNRNTHGVFHQRLPSRCESGRRPDRHEF